MRVLQIIARGIQTSLTFVSSKPGVGVVRPQADAATRLSIEYDDPDHRERLSVGSHIAGLMLEDEWVEIGDQIADWEADLISTPGGLRFHEIAVDVALSGLQTLIDDAAHTDLSDLDAAEVELGYFVDTWQRSPDSYVLAILAARAHLLLGIACRADHWPDACRKDAWRRMAKHYVAAGDIIAQYDARALMSPLMAEAEYMQGLGSPGQAHRIPELFENWITLDPSNPAIYAAHAVWLADPTLVSNADILTLAEEALARTEQTVGSGGYALFFQPLLQTRPDVRAIYDPELYASGLLDLATMSSTQAEVNRMADALAGEVNAAGSNAHVALRDTLLMMIRMELTVLYPRLWTLSDEAIRGLIKDARDAVPDLSRSDTVMSRAA